MLDWDDARAFLAIARHGTLTAASSELQCGIATLSRRITRFEQSLGVVLFSRHQTGYRLTDDGEQLIPKAEALETAAFALAESAELGVSGRVRVATAETLANTLFIPSLTDLLKSNPRLSIEFVTDVATINLHKRDADLAIRMVRPERGNVTVKRIGALGYGLYGSQSYIEKRANKKSGEDLSSDKFIVWSERYSGLPQAEWLDNTIGTKVPVLVTTSLANQIAATTADLGLSVLPHFVTKGTSLQQIGVEVSVTQDIWLVLHADLAHSQRIRAVADHFETVINRSSDLLSGGR